MARTSPAIAASSWDSQVRDWNYVTSTISAGGKFIVPTYSFRSGGGYKTLVSEGESGKQRRRSKRSTLRRTWQLNFDVHKEEADRILDFFDYVLGAYGSFTFTCPREDIAYTVRITSDNLDVNWENYVIHKLSLEFEEIL